MGLGFGERKRTNYTARGTSERVSARAARAAKQAPAASEIEIERLCLRESERFAKRNKHKADCTFASATHCSLLIQF